MQDQEAYADCAGSNLHFSRFGISEIRILRVDDKCDGRRRWYQFAKELKPLCGQLQIQSVRTCDVATRLVEARNEAALNRVRANRKDHRN